MGVLECRWDVLPRRPKGLQSSAQGFNPGNRRPRVMRCKGARIRVRLVDVRLSPLQGETWELDNPRVETLG
jgi:hypothetical protein